MSLSKFVCGFFYEELVETLEISSTDPIPAGFQSQKLWGLMVLVPGTGTLDWGTWCGTGTPHS